MFEERNDGIDFGLFWKSKFNFMCNKLILAESFISGEINRNCWNTPEQAEILPEVEYRGLPMWNFLAIPAGTKWYP